MSFADEVVKDGRGVAYKVDISIDGFATVAYRYGTGAQLDPTYDYDPRIRSIGRVSRGLTADSFAQAGSVGLVLANDDELADWMVDAATAVELIKARFRLYVGLYDPAESATPKTFAWQQLGEYVADGFPRRNLEQVELTLVDDVLGFLDQSVALPTFADWYEQDVSTSNPLRAGVHFGFDADAQPIPLCWGNSAFRAVFAGDPFGGDILNIHYNVHAYAAFLTTSSAAIAATDVVVLWAKLNDGRVLMVPKEVTDRFGSYELWKVAKSGAIVKNGKTFYVVWIGIRRDLLHLSIKGNDGSWELDEVWFGGYPLSARTTTTPDQHAADIVADIVTHYSGGSAAKIDTASFARVKAATSSINAAGTIAPGAAAEARSLRDEISSIAASCDFSVFMTLDGKVGLASRNLDYASQTVALPAITEESIADVEDWIPSTNQRGAPFNRIVLVDQRETPIFRSPPPGPYDDPGGAISSWGRPIVREISTRWLSPFQSVVANPWSYRNVEAAIRPAITFRTDLFGLTLDPGDFFELTWTRNLGDPYVSAIFQLDEVTLDPGENTVTIRALYAGDLRTDRPYLLDDEANHVLSTGSGARTASVQDGSLIVSLSSGSVVTDGVQRNDVLVLKDATQAATVFTRFRAIRIESVDSATQLTLEATADTAFGSVPPVAVSTWEIRRGVVNAALLTGANYPDGATMYGAVADSSTAGTYSDTNAAHKLLEG